MLKTNKKASTLKKEKSLSVTMEMEEILSSLANQDALKIFKVANVGISSSTEVIKELGLTQKRYYSRLRQLIEAGLIEKIGDAYKHTIFGKLVFKLGEKFQEAISNRDRLDLMDRLNKAKTISIDETKEIINSLSKGGIVGYSEGLLSPIRMADTWEKVVDDVIQEVENSQTSIYFATQYFDIRVVEAIMRAAQRGVTMNFLSADNDSLTARIRIGLSMISSVQALKFFFKAIKSSQFRVRLTSYMPYTFIVIDEKNAMIEISKPYTKAFSIAFFFQNVKLCQRLIESFESLYNKGSDIKETLTKSLTDAFLKKRKGPEN